MSKLVYRMTESEFKRLVNESVKQTLREYDNSFMLQVVAQAIIGNGSVNVKAGENEKEFDLGNGKMAFIKFNVDSSPYYNKGRRSSSYDVEDDPDTLVDTPTVEIYEIEVVDDDESSCFLEDNGIIAKALNDVIEVDYDYGNIPSGNEYFNEY